MHVFGRCFCFTPGRCGLRPAGKHLLPKGGRCPVLRKKPEEPSWFSDMPEDERLGQGEAAARNAELKALELSGLLLVSYLFELIALPRVPHGSDLSAMHGSGSG